MPFGPRGLRLHTTQVSFLPLSFTVTTQTPSVSSIGLSLEPSGSPTHSVSCLGRYCDLDISPGSVSDTETLSSSESP